MQDGVALQFENMIDKKCFTTEWIQQKSIEFKYNDRNIIEKVIRAMSLLDMLVSSGCPCYFKGGSCLMLLLSDSRHRLSIDIDVMCPPGTDIEKYLTKYAESGFIDYKLVERKQTTADVPKSHSKFFYQVAFKADSDATGYILLDVLYEDCHYQQTTKIPIRSVFIETIGEPVMVNVPSIGDILGDKLTAFAPETTGIPYYKNDKLATLEIIKQLYDVGRLFDRVEDLTVTNGAFQKIAQVEMGYRDLDGELKLIYDDIRNTSLILALRGQKEREKFDLLQKGIKSITSFMYKSDYHIDDAITDSAKAAYLATLLEKGVTRVEHYDGNPQTVANLTVGRVFPQKLSKLRMGNPEAFYYWAKAEELL